MDAIRNVFDSVDIRIWGLAVLALATVLTLQAVETAVDGAWPHQRRAGRMPVAARGGQRGWAVSGLLLLVALLLAMLNLAVVAWKDLNLDATQTAGALLVGVAWLLFLLATTDRTPFGRYLRQLGPAGPSALSILTLAGGVLLLIAFLNVLPPLHEVRDALPV